MMLLVLLVLGAVALGVWLGMREHRAAEQGESDADSGWLYVAGIADEHEPVMVGVIDDLARLAWPPMRSMRIAGMDEVGQALKDELAPYRVRGQWYDRDAALAFFDHLSERTAA